MEKYRFLEHTADIKFLAFGKTQEEAFSNSAYALREIMSKDKINETRKKQLKVNGKDYESLLYNFLEEFLYILDSENFIFSKIRNIKIEMKNKNGKEKFYELFAEVSGDDAINYEFKMDVKAVTYNEMFVRQEKDKTWAIQVVVDV
ncbi:MAG: archease [Candidatus Nanoarchaeia archaeon]